MQEKTMMMKMKFHNVYNFSLFCTFTIFVNIYEYKTFYLGPDCLDLNIFKIIGKKSIVIVVIYSLLFQNIFPF